MALRCGAPVSQVPPMTSLTRSNLRGRRALQLAFEQISEESGKCKSDTAAQCPFPWSLHQVYLVLVPFLHRREEKTMT
jgi:hypothetical protein